MLYWALICAVCALIFGVLGFSGLAGAFATIARFLLALFLILLIMFLLLGWGGLGVHRTRHSSLAPAPIHSAERTAKSMCRGVIPG